MRSFLIAALWCAMFFLGGCSQQDGRHMVTGMVTFDGAAVAVGEVVIEPDAAAGNRGPQARASISEGRFRTAPRKGAIAGDVIVEIWGADGAGTNESPSGQVLFSKYRVKMHLPAKSSTLDIVVPRNASASNEKSATGDQ